MAGSNAPLGSTSLGSAGATATDKASHGAKLALGLRPRGQGPVALMAVGPRQAGRQAAHGEHVRASRLGAELHSQNPEQGRVLLQAYPFAK